MKTLEVKCARLRKGYSQKEMASKMGLGLSSYCLKENGKTGFSMEEALSLARLLDLTPGEFNDYFYDGLLPIAADTQW